MRVLYWR